MGYLLIYLAIGVYFSLRLPIDRRRTLDKIDQIEPEKWAAMSTRERLIMQTLIDSARTEYKPWQLVAVGMLWPLQVVFGVAAHFWGGAINRRAEKTHLHRLVPTAECPSCNENLLGRPGVDLVESTDGSGSVKFVCSCGAGSEWKWRRTGGFDHLNFIRTVPVRMLADKSQPPSQPRAN